MCPGGLRRPSGSCSCRVTGMQVEQGPGAQSFCRSASVTVLARLLTSPGAAGTPLPLGPDTVGEVLEDPHEVGGAKGHDGSSLRSPPKPSPITLLHDRSFRVYLFAGVLRVELKVGRGRR